MTYTLLAEGEVIATALSSRCARDLRCAFVCRPRNDGRGLIAAARSARFAD